MFINVINFPPIKAGMDTEFRQWFAWSSKEFAKHKGLISRKLLLTRGGDNYAALVEYESYATYIAIHTSPAQTEANQRVKPLLGGSPSPQFFEVVEIIE